MIIVVESQSHMDWESGDDVGKERRAEQREMFEGFCIQREEAWKIFYFKKDRVKWEHGLN